MIKLKNLLKEGYAWERKPNKPLPTLEDVQKEYQKKKMKEVIKDKDGNVRTDLKYQDTKHYQPRIDVKKEKFDGNGFPTIEVDIDGKTYNIQFDDFDPSGDDHGQEKDGVVSGQDEYGEEWTMMGTAAFHGDLLYFDYDSLEKYEGRY